jgi:hypothetical protein
MATTTPTLKQLIDALLDTFSEEQLRHVLDFARSVSAAAGGNPYAINPQDLLEFLSHMSPEAIEAQHEVTRILQEEHEREMRRLESEA